MFELILNVLTNVSSSSFFVFYYLSSLNIIGNLILCGFEKL